MHPAAFDVHSRIGLLSTETGAALGGSRLADTIATVCDVTD
jgi:hypothetical protein